MNGPEVKSKVKHVTHHMTLISCVGLRELTYVIVATGNRRRLVFPPCTSVTGSSRKFISISFNELCRIVNCASNPLLARWQKCLIALVTGRVRRRRTLTAEFVCVEWRKCSFTVWITVNSSKWPCFPGFDIWTLLTEGCLIPKWQWRFN